MLAGRGRSRSQQRLSQVLRTMPRQHPIPTRWKRTRGLRPGPPRPTNGPYDPRKRWPI